MSSSGLWITYLLKVHAATDDYPWLVQLLLSVLVLEEKMFDLLSAFAYVFFIALSVTSDLQS